MPKIVKVGNVKFNCFTPYEADRWPNVLLGKNCRIRTNNVLKKDPRLNQFFNEETMGALDNYAEHENLNIYIKPLENDMFNDVAVSVYKDSGTKATFPMNVAKTKDEVPEFFRELYNKVHKAIHPDSKGIADTVGLEKFKKPTFLGDLKMYAKNVIDRFNDARFEFAERILK